MIKQAVILAAGEGSRLRDKASSKPLCPVAGWPLIDHAIERLAIAGIERVIVVTGYAADRVEAYLESRGWPVSVGTVRTPDWTQPNGVSALAAAASLQGAETLLLMADHLVEPALYRRMAEAGPGPGLNLAIDRRLGHPWVDPDDVTCVRTEDGRIIAIAKHLDPHDAYDTGVFAVGQIFFETLAKLHAPSISSAVSALAVERKAVTTDCSDLGWLDVDDARALAIAEDWLSGRDHP